MIWFSLNLLLFTLASWRHTRPESSTFQRPGFWGGLHGFGLLYEANSVSASKLTLACLRHHDLRCQGLASEPLSKIRLDHVKVRFSIGSLVVVGQGFFRCCM